MSLRVSLVVSVVVGLVVAAAVALLVPRTAPSVAAGRDLFTPPPAAAPAPAHPRLAPARRDPRGPGWVALRATTRPRIEVRVDDPRGGPQWAVRVFAAERRADGNVIGEPRCAQLGRIRRGRFGWVDATNTFRRVPVGYRGAPSWCGSTLPDLRRQPHLDVLTRITDPSDGRADPLQTVAWGIAGPAGTPRLNVDGSAYPAETGPSGTFLAFIPQEYAATVGLRVAYAGGDPVIVGSSPAGFRGSDDAVAGRPPARPRPDEVPRIELRLPDPSGGLPWGLSAVRAADGGWCTGELGRIVGERVVGWVDFELGTITDGPASPDAGCPPRERDPRTPPNRRRPLAVGSTGGGTAHEPGQDPLTGRVARRTLRGMTTYSGTAHPDVEAITIRTPRDVRTIRPSPRAHAFAAIYDGSFPAGRIVFTAHMADGSTRREVIPASPF